MEAGPFAEPQVRLLETFAAQAVIAIENVRLFQELQTRNRELTEALEQQTATSEVLKVVIGSPIDLEPVLETIENATRLCDGPAGGMFRWDGEVSHDGGPHASRAEGVHWSDRLSVPGVRRPWDGWHSAARSFTSPTSQPIYRGGGAMRIAGLRAVLAVPMFREGALIGAMAIWSERKRGSSPRSRSSW